MNLQSANISFLTVRNAFVIHQATQVPPPRLAAQYEVTRNHDTQHTAREDV
jgi:hypothetical protein